MNFIIRRKLPDFDGYTAASLSKEIIAMLDYLQQLDSYIDEQEIISLEIFANTCYNLEYLSSVFEKSAFNLNVNIGQESDKELKAELKRWSREFFGDSIRAKLLSDKLQFYTANYD